MKKKNKIKNNLKEIINLYSKWIPPKSFIIVLFLIISLFYGITYFKIDGDFWFLINTGKHIINNGIPHIEPFTIHTNLNFIAQQWLTDIIFYLIYDKFSVYGMLLLLTLLNIFIILISYKMALLVSDGKVKTSVLTILLFECIFIITFFTTRPQIFDTLFLSLELYLLELYIKKKKKTHLIGLPIISLLMINFHSSLWLMIFVFLVPYYIEKLFSKDKNEIKVLIITTILMLICAIFNPYGIESFKYLFNSYGIDIINNLVGEMKAITISSGLPIFIYIAITVYSFYYNKGKNKLRYLLLVLGTTYLALNHTKGALFLIICSIPVLSYNFKNLFKEEKKFIYKEKSINILMIIIAIICLFIYIHNIITIDLEEKTRTYQYDIGEYFINNVNKDVKVYTDYNTGGYLEYLGYRCYLDSRAEVFLKANNKKEDILKEYYKLQTNQLSINFFLEKYNFDYLLVSEKDILFFNLDDKNYREVYQIVSEDLNYKIYEKAN